MISCVNLRGVSNLMAIQDGQKVESTRSNSSQWSWFWELSKALADLSNDASLYTFQTIESSSSKANHNPTHHSPWRNWMKRSQTEGEMGPYRQVPEKWWKVHRNIIGTSYFLRKATLSKVSSSWTLFYAAFFGERHMLVDLDREILNMAEIC